MRQKRCTLTLLFLGCDGGFHRVFYLADLADFAAQQGGQAIQVFGGNAVGGPFRQFLIDSVQFAFQALELLLARGENLLLERLQFDGAEGTDFHMFLAIPIDEGTLGDIEMSGDASQAPTPGRAAR